eukprot:2992431-Amphidinium_carterae.3
MSTELTRGLVKECEISDTLCPDVIEWCPVEMCRDMLLYGTYKHLPDIESRVGAVHLCRLESCSSAGETASSALSLKKVETIDLPG